MTNRATLTLKKPLSLEKESQLFQVLKTLKEPALEKKKLSKQEQENEMKAAQKKKREDIKATLKWLEQNYPNCFNAQAPKSLKIKIEEDIFPDLPSDKSITKIKVKQAIAYYTRNRAYLKSLLQETHRYDLKGLPAQEITLKHKAWAQGKLEAIMKKIKERTERVSLQVNKSLQN